MNNGSAPRQNVLIRKENERIHNTVAEGDPRMSSSEDYAEFPEEPTEYLKFRSPISGVAQAFLPVV